jgi:hypothetical protein
MRVTKDGTEILLRQDYSKVVAALKTMADTNLRRLTYPVDALTRVPQLGVVESAAGMVCQLSLHERAANPVDGHTSHFEAKRVSDGLTRVRIKSEQWGVGASSLFTGKLPRTRTPDVEVRRLEELSQTIGK